MNILIPTSSYPLRGYPGWAPFLKETVLALAEKGHSVTVLVFHPDNKRLEYREPGHKNVKVLAYPFLPWGKSRLHSACGLMPSLKSHPLAILELPFYLAASAREILRAVSREPIDVVHALWYLPMGFLAAALKPFHKKPVVISALGGDFYLNPRLFAGLLRYTAARADRNCACSRYLAGKASQYGLPESLFTVIPNAIRVRHFLNPTPRSKKTRIIAACVKRLVAEKNILDLLEAARLLDPAAKEKLWIRIAGEGPEEPVLRETIEKFRLEDFVTLEGFVAPENMPAFLEEADILIDPSTQEGFATSNLEALASGCALVAADTAGNPEMIHHLQSGLLYPSRDTAALAKTLASLAEDSVLRERLSEAGKIKAQELWDVSAAAVQWDMLYRGLFSLRRPAPTSQTHFTPAAAT